MAGSYPTASAISTSAFTLATAGNYTIYGRIFDKDGGFTNCTTAIVVNAATPVDVTSLVTFNYYGAQYNSKTKTYGFYECKANGNGEEMKRSIYNFNVSTADLFQLSFTLSVMSTSIAIAFRSCVIYHHKWLFINEIQARRASEGIQIREPRNDSSTVKHGNSLAGAAGLYGMGNFKKR